MLFKNRRITDTAIVNSKLPITQRFFKKKLGFEMPSYDALYRKTGAYEDAIAKKEAGCEYCNSMKAYGSDPKVTINNLLQGNYFNSVYAMNIQKPAKVRTEIVEGGVKVYQEEPGATIAVKIDFCPFCGKELRG